MISDTNLILHEIRSLWAQQWKKEYYTKRNEIASEPTDKELGFPLQTLTVQWETGYLLIDLSALAKMPAATRNKICKLGGIK